MDNLSNKETTKLQKELEIIKAAEELFYSKGFENTSMDELAQKVRYTKRTIYKYFTCKEDLFFAVILNAYLKLTSTVNKLTNEPSTGFDKIKTFYNSFNNFSSINPNLLKLMSMLGVAQGTTNNDVNMPYKMQFYKFNQNLFNKIYKLFEEGKKDGSIRNDFETSKLVYSSVFTLTGFFFMLSMSGNSYTENFKLDKDDFITFTLELLLNSFKS